MPAAEGYLTFEEWLRERGHQDSYLNYVGTDLWQEWMAYVQDFLASQQNGNGNGNGGPGDDLPVGPTEPVPPEEYYGGEPEAAYLRKLQGAGMYGQATPFRNWLVNQGSPQYNRWYLGRGIAGLEGQDPQSFYNAPTQWGRSNLWNRLQGAPGGEAKQDWISQNLGDVWNIGAGIGGAFDPFSVFLKNQQERKLAEWKAFHQQGAPGVTQPMSFMDYIRQYMPGR